MHYTRAEQWPGYKMISLKSRPEGGSESGVPCRGSLSPPLFRALGAKSPVCENHRKAEQEYSAVKAAVKAESQRKLDLALKKAQSARTQRTACLSSMFVRPNSAVNGLSQVWEEMADSHPNDSVSLELNGTNSEGKRLCESASEFRKENHDRIKHNISTNGLRLEKSRRVLYPKYQVPPGTFEYFEDVDLLQQYNKDMFNFRDYMKQAATPLNWQSSNNPELRNFSSHEFSKRQKLIFSFLRREMRREKSIVVPLGSIPGTLQVKGHNSRLYNYPRFFKGGQTSMPEVPMSETPLRPVHNYNIFEKPSSPSAARRSTPKTSTQSTTPRCKSAKPVVYRDLGIVTEYKLKMASLMTQPDKMPTLSRRPATAGPITHSRDHLTENQSTKNNLISLKISQDIKQDETHSVRPKSSTENRGAMGIKIPTQENKQGARRESKAYNLREETQGSQTFSKSSFEGRKIRSWTAAPIGKKPSFVKGVKYGEIIEKKPISSMKDPEEVTATSTKGVEGKTELTSTTPRSLSLSVFLPRENNEESLCDRADSFSYTTNTVKTDFLPKSYEANISIQRQNGGPDRFNSLRYSHEQGTLETSAQKNTVIYDSTNMRGLQCCKCAAPTHSPLDNQQGRLRVLHCELFGPELCQDCQVHMERADVYTWQQAVHPDVGTDIKRLIAGPIQRSCPSPASINTGSDLGEPDDPEIPLEPLDSIANNDLDINVPH